MFRFRQRISVLHSAICPIYIALSLEKKVYSKAKTALILQESYEKEVFGRSVYG